MAHKADQIRRSADWQEAARVAHAHQDGRREEIREREGKDSAEGRRDALRAMERK